MTNLSILTDYPEYFINPDMDKIKEHTSHDELGTFVDLYCCPIADCVMDGEEPIVVECHVLCYLLPLYLVLQYKHNHDLLVNACSLSMNDLSIALEILEESVNQLQQGGVYAFNQWWRLHYENNIQNIMRLTKIQFELV